MITREELKALFDKAGLAHVADDLMAMVKPAIHIKTTRISDEAQLPIGTSKFGGSPDLPAGFSWPYWNDIPLTFMGQLWVADVAPYDVENVLPSVGWLYFFYEVDAKPCGVEPADRGGWRVFYLADKSWPLERIPHPAAQGKLGQIKALPPCTLELSEELTLPTNIRIQQKLNFSDEEWERYREVIRVSSRLKHLRIKHHLLGFPDAIQNNDMELECQFVSNGLGPRWYDDRRRFIFESGVVDWQLLLQIDTDNYDLGVIWGDSGRIYYWIQRQALQERNFDNSWLTLQCH